MAMKLSGWACLWIVASALAASGCGVSAQDASDEARAAEETALQADRRAREVSDRID